jgi:hypothetical protein
MSSKLSLSALFEPLSPLASAQRNGDIRSIKYLKNRCFVIPAQAGIHHLTCQNGARLRKTLNQVMDSRLRGNDERAISNSLSACRQGQILALLKPPLFTPNPRLTETHLLRCSPYIYVYFVYLSRFLGGFTLAEIGVSGHRQNHD